MSSTRRRLFKPFPSSAAMKSRPFLVTPKTCEYFICSQCSSQHFSTAWTRCDPSRPRAASVDCRVIPVGGRNARATQESEFPDRGLCAAHDHRTRQGTACNRRCCWVGRHLSDAEDFRTRAGRKPALSRQGDRCTTARSVRGSHRAVISVDLQGFGMPVIEAMSCGALTVHSRQTAMDEITASLGIAVPATDIFSWLEAMLAAIEDSHTSNPNY